MDGNVLGVLDRNPAGAIKPQQRLSVSVKRLNGEVVLVLNLEHPGIAEEAAPVGSIKEVFVKVGT